MSLWKHQVDGVKRIHADDGVHALLWQPGCLAGDTEIVVNRGGASRRMRIDELVRKFNGGPSGKYGRQRWRVDMSTNVQCAVNGLFRMAPLEAAWFSGVKTTWNVVTDSGRTVRATADHPFLTPDGWKNLGELVEGDSVCVVGRQKGGGTQKRPDYLYVSGLYHHPNATGRGRKESPYRVVVHRLVVEADANGLEFFEYIRRLKKGDQLEGLVFLPRDVHVHHKNHNRQDNRLENLAALDAAEHLREHAAPEHVLYKVATETITRISLHGEEPTYDLRLATEPHNFTANGFVVHNSGKSATVVRYLEELVEQLDHQPLRVLIVCPKSVLGVWPQEFEKHCRMPYVTRTLDGPLTERFERLGGVSAEAPPPGFHIAVTLTAYSTFSAKPHARAALAAVKAYAPDVIVLDEAHAIKSAQSNTSKLLGKIGQLCPRRLILTGTPTPHSPADVYAQWRFLDPGAFAGPDGKMVSYSRWLDGYAVYGGYLAKQVVAWRDLDDMEERMARKSSVIKTADCHSLPPLVVQKHTFALAPAEQRSYDQMRRDLLTVVEDDTITAANKMVSVLRLRQICAGFLPNEDGVVRQVGTTRRDLALGLIENLMASEKRVVVYAWSKHEVDGIYEALMKSPPWGAWVMRIAGDTPSPVRETALKGFATGVDERVILVAQVDTVSSGTNALVSASHVLYLSLSNSAGTWQQSLARFHRPGQQAGKVVAHVLQAESTVDEAILDALEGRVELQDAMMSHIREVKR